MSDEMRWKAVVYWQDRMAKFFPTSPGPTDLEVAMFKAGYELAKKEMAAEQASCGCSGTLCESCS